MCKNLHVEGKIAILWQKLEFVGFLCNFIETIIFLVAILEHVSSERGGWDFWVVLEVIMVGHTGSFCIPNYIFS